MIAPHVCSTLYNILCQIHAPATLSNYVHVHVMNSILLSPCDLRRNVLCFFPAALDAFIEETFEPALRVTKLTHSYVEASFTLPSVAVKISPFMTAYCV
jgi:hypothetical protein